MKYGEIKYNYDALILNYKNGFYEIVKYIGLLNYSKFVEDASIDSFLSWDDYTKLIDIITSDKLNTKPDKHDNL